MTATCIRCGRIEADPPLTWSLQVEPARPGGPAEPRWLCVACTREHVRAIESRLDETWW